MSNLFGYIGETIAVPSIDGWNANLNIDLIPPSNVTDIINMNLHKGGRNTRGGVSKVNSTAITNTVQLMGGYQFRLKNKNEFILTATADGKIQKDYVTELKTSLTLDVYSMFETFEDKAYICNGADRPQTWDGTATGTTQISGIPSDWTGTNWPKHIIKHGKGISESLWAYGCSLNPESIYVSQNGTDNFADGQVQKIPIDTKDGFGIVAGMEFGDKFFAFGKRKTYVIDDSSTTRSNWGYNDVQWEGGAAHERAVCKTPNDLIIFDENLELYSITTTQAYGDYKAASLTRPAFINVWIANNVDKSQINKFHIVYDDDIRAIKWFVVRNGQTRADTALVFFIDKGVANGWTRHLYASVNFASCSFPVRVSAANWKIYTGGHNGNVFQLETTTFNDDGVKYYNGYTTPYLGFENARISKNYFNGWLVLVPQGTETVKGKVSVDGNSILGGYPLVDENGVNITDENGNEIFGNSEETFTVIASASSTLQNLVYPIRKNGNRIRTEVYNETINESFFISQQLFDFEYLEKKPA